MKTKQNNLKTWLWKRAIRNFFFSILYTCTQLSHHSLRGEKRGGEGEREGKMREEGRGEEGEEGDLGHSFVSANSHFVVRKITSIICVSL